MSSLACTEYWVHPTAPGQPLSCCQLAEQKDQILSCILDHNWCITHSNTYDLVNSSLSGMLAAIVARLLLGCAGGRKIQTARLFDKRVRSRGFGLFARYRIGLSVAPFGSTAGPDRLQSDSCVRSTPYILWTCSVNIPSCRTEMASNAYSDRQLV